MNHRMRGHLKRQLKNGPLTVQQKYLARLVCKGANQPVGANAYGIIVYIHSWRQSGISALVLDGRYGFYFAHEFFYWSPPLHAFQCPALSAG